MKTIRMKNIKKVNLIFGDLWLSRPNKILYNILNTILFFFLLQSRQLERNQFGHRRVKLNRRSSAKLSNIIVRTFKKTC